jgi:NAD(P)-dependent dehydrogenase (short-subunit alcohol dehydrogenase family)
MESLTPEVAPFGIRTMLVEPGFFRTELLTPESTRYAASTIDNYAERTDEPVAGWKRVKGNREAGPANSRTPLSNSRDRPSRHCASPLEGVVGSPHGVIHQVRHCRLPRALACGCLLG